MNTYKELIYTVLDCLKLISDDSTYTEEHILFLLNQYRTFILKQRYSDIKKQIPESNYQTICIDLEKIDTSTDNDCYGKQYLRSTKQIPYLIKIGNPKIYPIDYYSGEITLVSRERMRYVGYNNYLQNIIYASIGPDNYLYLKSNNPQYLYLNKVKLTGIFDNAEVASDLQCEENDSSCDILDRNFPLESSLVPQVIELVVKALSGSIYKPKDPNNDAADNLSEIASFLRNNMKSNFQKQFEG